MVKPGPHPAVDQEVLICLSSTHPPSSEADRRLPQRTTAASGRRSLTCLDTRSISGQSRAPLTRDMCSPDVAVGDVDLLG